MSRYIDKLHIFYITLFTLFFSTTYASLATHQSESTVLLIKFPTRQRNEKFFNTLDLYYKKMSGNIPFHIVVSCDVDDVDMNNPATIKRLKTYPHLTCYFGNNNNKIEAVNADIDKFPSFKVLLLASDDMIPLEQNYDEHIVNSMTQYFPDLDGVLHYNDGFWGEGLNTLSIMGKKYFDRFGYIYHPGYKSVFCDNEFTIVSRNLHKVKYIDKILIEHQHPLNGKAPQDALYIQNDANEYNQHDKQLFLARRAKHFDLPTTLLIKFPTRQKNKQFFTALDKYYEKLSTNVPYHFLVTCDVNDIEMNNEQTIARLNSYPNLTYCFRNNKNEIEASNANLELFPKFEVVLLASENLIPIVQNYDEYIVNTLKSYFPDLDGVLHLNDGYNGPKVNSLCIMGKKYYDRFNYIYNPKYNSLYCNNVFTDISQALGKSIYIETVLIEHQTQASDDCS
ncbi:MAG: hypothetical protein P0S95_07375 [Rhabdochlamydiaceae bacterium]|nr:hypothetical protein [Candidatus Amphrikana amoebophyrae]